jgi:hypothetical protein
MLAYRRFGDSPAVTVAGHRLPRYGHGMAAGEEGARLPSTQHRWPRGDGPWVVTLGWRVIDGRPECVEVNIAGGEDVTGPLTGTLLRQIGIPGFIAADRAAMMPAEEPAVPAGMRRSTVERFRRVAAVYRKALAEAGNPVQAVAAEFNLTGPSAANLVARARAAGFLPPASPGVPVG